LFAFGRFSLVTAVLAIASGVLMILDA